MTFLTPEQGGRKMPPFQGYRSDVAFVDDPDPRQIHMIHPEFLNDDDSVYPSGIPAPLTLRANMRVFWKETRPFYREKIYVGLSLQIREGTKTVALATVTKILNLPND